MQEYLPDVLVKELQKYVQAGYIYIPAKREQHKSWGEWSGYRKELEWRNKAIIAEYHRGVPIGELADKYCLSAYAIRKIISEITKGERPVNGRLSFRYFCNI